MNVVSVLLLVQKGIPAGFASKLVDAIQLLLPVPPPDPCKFLSSTKHTYNINLINYTVLGEAKLLREELQSLKHSVEDIKVCMIEDLRIKLDIWHPFGGDKVK